MRIAINLDTRRIVSWANEPISGLSMTRSDRFPVELRIIDGAGYTSLPEGATGRLLLKRMGQYSGAAVAAAQRWEASAVGGRNARYAFDLDLDTEEVAALFAQEPAEVEVALEIEWAYENVRQTSVPVPVVLANEYIRADESTPSATPNLKATQAMAEAGTDNEHWMTPLTTAQAIAKQSINAKYIRAFAISDGGLTAYTGSLPLSDKPAAPALAEAATTWKIRRSTLSTSGSVLSISSATGSWSNRENLIYTIQ